MNKVYLCELCIKEYSPEEIKGVRVLKVFEGYTIDLRLQQFRKIEMDKLPEFIEFESEKGQELLSKMHSEVLN